ncbi:hypothetical protein ACODNH_23570 (plasmid) [Haloarcula sp. NS06]|jgi:ribonuclease Z|uniref:hypothetical protein n=1 Tax=Haloarcula sp. NS06 TaxID=3409688 RepID=UPI003DA76CE2
MIDGLEIVSLGVGSTIPDHRPLSATYVNVDGYEFLIDAPEGVQYRLFKHSCGLTIDDIYITNSAKRSLLGLPGLLNTLSYMAERTDPLTIHTPRQTLSKVREVEDWYSNIKFDINIQEVLPGSRVIERDDWFIDTIDNSIAGSYGLKIEDEPRGEFNREKAKELGVPVGPKFSKLCDGEPVEASDGSTVLPEQVLDTDAKDPIQIVFSGRTDISSAVETAGQLCDVLIHDAATLSEFQSNGKRASVSQAVELASRVNPDHMFLNRLTSGINHLSDGELIRKANDTSSVPLDINVLSEGTRISVRRNEVQISES